MSARKALAITVFAAPLALLLSGCTYDYIQHSDRVGYKAGDAVAANLEAETIDPSKHSMYVTSGLGKNGAVSTTVVAAATGSAGSAAPAAPAAPRPQ